jgi:DNA repair photolyase
MIRQATFPLLFVLSPSLRSDPAEAIARGQERSVRRAALRRAPIVLGTAAAPYEPSSRGHHGDNEESPLRQLLPLADGLQIAITTASPRILGEIDLLTELDRRHAVTVRLIVPVPSVLDPGPRLRAAQSLTAEGIATVLKLTPVTPAGPLRSPRQLVAEMRLLLEAAREAGIYDVELTETLEMIERVEPPKAWKLPKRPETFLRDAFAGLRLEHGFPRSFAGRG